VFCGCESRREGRQARDRFDLGWTFYLIHYSTIDNAVQNDDQLLVTTAVILDATQVVSRLVLHQTRNLRSVVSFTC
jgi:hypothetical protein